MVYQYKKEFRLAEKYYKESIEIAPVAEIKARGMNDLAGMYVESGKIDIALAILDEVSSMIQEKWTLALAYNYKWRGIIAIQQNKPEEAIGFYKKTENLIKEKGVFKQLSEILYCLADKLRDNFHEAAEHMGEALVYRKKYEGVSIRNEKMHNILDDCYDIG